MQLNKAQQSLGWAILLLCVISVPVGLWGRYVASTPTDKDGDSDKKFSFMGRKDRIQVIKLSGMIVNDEDQSSIFPDPNSSTSVRKQLKRAAKDNKIKAVLLRINSPGGTVAMSQEITDAVKEVRAKDKPVIVSMGDVAASGGYYIASQANKIYASPGTLTGSIGVIMHLYSLQGIEQKLGIQPFTIKSGEFKDIGSMDRPPTKAEEKLLHDIIMDSYDQFITAVSEGRKMDKEAVRKLADGRIYTGRQAFQVKLVDAIGGYDDALDDLKKTCKEKYKKDLAVDEGKTPTGILSALLESKIATPELNVFKSMLPESMNPKFNHMPLWMMQ